MKQGPLVIDPNAERITLEDLRRGLTEYQLGWLRAQLNIEVAAREIARRGREAINAERVAKMKQQIQLDWYARDALRCATEKGEIWRDNRTKRGVDYLVSLGMLEISRMTKTRAYYKPTAAGSALAQQLPTKEAEWADIRTDVDDPTHLSNTIRSQG